MGSSLRVWNLGFFWDLGFGIWNLRLVALFSTGSEAIGGAASCDSGRGLPHSKRFAQSGDLPNPELLEFVPIAPREGQPGAIAQNDHVLTMK